MLLTIGYEKASFEDVANRLREAGVSTVIDVRAQPHSRRREFAYKYLGPGLADHGINYESWPSLGAPEAAREAARAGNPATFNRLYQGHLGTDVAQQALSVLSERSMAESPCILCYERDPRQCHRLLIAERMEECGVIVHHLMV